MSSKQAGLLTSGSSLAASLPSRIGPVASSRPNSPITVAGPCRNFTELPFSSLITTGVAQGTCFCSYAVTFCKEDPHDLVRSLAWPARCTAANELVTKAYHARRSVVKQTYFVACVDLAFGSGDLPLFSPPDTDCSLNTRGQTRPYAWLPARR